jgi:hypothetical protein
LNISKREAAEGEEGDECGGDAHFHEALSLLANYVNCWQG